MTTFHNMFRNAADAGLSVRWAPKPKAQAKKKNYKPHSLQDQAGFLRKQLAKLTKELAVVEEKIRQKNNSHIIDRQDGVTFFKAVRRH